MIVLPATSMIFAPAGRFTWPAAPTAATRLSVTTMSPFSMTSVSPAPFIVTIRALARTIDPCGRARGTSTTGSNASGLSAVSACR
jgi:hypothetical protein